MSVQVHCLMRINVEEPDLKTVNFSKIWGIFQQNDCCICNYSCVKFCKFAINSGEKARGGGGGVGCLASPTCLKPCG